MKEVKKARARKKYEPYYSEILKLSEKKNITLSEARKELIKKAVKNNKQ